MMPLEVALLIKVGARGNTNVTPLLLDWCNMGETIVIVIERPDPCLDLVMYVNSLKHKMKETEAKVSTFQIVFV